MLNDAVLGLYTATEVNDEPLKPVKFGTSGHRGTSLKGSFNQRHIMAIAQAVADYRQQHNINGPLFLGRDTHALSQPAWQTSLQVLTANGIDVRIAADDEVTATPLVSHAILTANRDHTEPKADGIIITPSHNPPEDGGIKYNTPDGGPADGSVTGWIETRANEYLQQQCAQIKSLELAQAIAAATPYDFVGVYVDDLSRVIDLKKYRRNESK